MWVERLSVKMASTESPIGSLSGGNQQKVMFGKALRLAPRMLLLDEPTQGVDVGAKDQIHRWSTRPPREGVATLVASTDTDELVRLCHRVIVLVDGRVGRHAAASQIAAETIEHTQLQTSREGSMIKRLGLDKYSAAVPVGAVHRRVHRPRRPHVPQLDVGEDDPDRERDRRRAGDRVPDPARDGHLRPVDRRR